MGLFINADMHPDVFMTRATIQEPNQAYYQYDVSSERMKEQKRINENIITTIQDMKSFYKHQEFFRQQKWKRYDLELESLQESQLQNDSFKQNARERFAMLEEDQKKLEHLLQNERTLNKEVAAQIREIHQSNQDMLTMLTEQENMNNQLTEQLTKQADTQDAVATRLDKQEALLEKALRQIDQFRSVIYERSNYLAEKVEKNYEMTSSYVYHLMTGSEKPFTFFMKSNKREENKKE
ncbi:hypothetical protein ACLIBG_10130 [Virgibacillus sp. W0181]|uniref:hypothetical protein n=1 Tax=Virgibacillus sp. W0181 TaxID=3391581 RepID=UPI003F45BC45